MVLRSLLLKNFRGYTLDKFTFSKTRTVIVGSNTAGKTNLTEAIQLLSSGKSFRGQSDRELIQFDHDLARIQGIVESGGEEVKLEVVILSPQSNNGRFGKKFFVNGVSKSRNSFMGYLPLVVFRPEELDIVVAGPSLRRQFLDDVLQSVDREYYLASISYEKALRQRNALLYNTREKGIKNIQQFSYWDDMIIRSGEILHEKRKELISYLNTKEKEIVDFEIVYDHSIISKERLMQYAQAEIHSANTLVGPHRDDFYFLIKDKKGVPQDAKIFGSRGQQRLVVLQLKLLHILFVSEKLKKNPLLVLDDIFSELDAGHIKLVLDKTSENQSILTTTHKEFLPKKSDEETYMVELQAENKRKDVF